MKDHLRSQLTLDQICQANLVGKSQLQKLFQKEQHCGVIHYFSYLKIEEAKQMIRQEQANFTEISAILPSIIFPGSSKPLPECLHQNMHFLSKHYRRKTPRTPCTDLWQGYCSLVSLLSTPYSVTTFCFFFSLAFLR